MKRWPVVSPVGAFLLLVACHAAAGSLTVDYPLAGAVFPRDMVAPTVRWSDGSDATRWRLTLGLPDGGVADQAWAGAPSWRPAAAAWR